ncbi:hypothetical protein GZL_03612 [Streptomyces sp. 769]|nr:hypothetical protein GZL_03612 [Streptomyces sp. 769]
MTVSEPDPALQDRGPMLRERPSSAGRAQAPEGINSAAPQHGKRPRARLQRAEPLATCMPTKSATWCCLIRSDVEAESLAQRCHLRKRTFLRPHPAQIQHGQELSSPREQP